MKPRKVEIRMMVCSDASEQQLKDIPSWEFWHKNSATTICKIQANVIKEGKRSTLGDIMKRLPVIKDKKFVDYLKTIGAEGHMKTPKRGKK